MLNELTQRKANKSPVKLLVSSLPWHHSNTLLCMNCSLRHTVSFLRANRYVTEVILLRRCCVTSKCNTKAQMESKLYNLALIWDAFSRSVLVLVRRRVCGAASLLSVPPCSHLSGQTLFTSNHDHQIRLSAVSNYCS